MSEATPPTYDPLPLPERVTTERLLLRPWRVEDTPLVHAGLTEGWDEMKRWIPWATEEAPTLDEAAKLVERWIREREGGVNFIYGAFDPKETRAIGGAGLYRRVGPEAIEIGYWVRSSEWARGYATEASRLLTRLAFALPWVQEVIAFIDPENLGSVRVPTKLGYEPHDDLDGEAGESRSGKPMLRFTLTRARFESEWADDDHEPGGGTR
jgi:RimJ/RimL family protein N-acetyltransferase